MEATRYNNRSNDGARTHRNVPCPVSNRGNALGASFIAYVSVQMAHMDGFGHGWGCMRSGWVRQRFRVYGYIRCTFPNIFTSLDAKLANIPRRFKET